MQTEPPVEKLEIVEDAPLIPKELELSVIQQDKSFEELMDNRRKLLTKVEKFDPVESVDDTPRMADAKRLQLDLAKNRNRIDDCLKAAGEGFRLKWKALCDVRRPLWLESESAEDWLKESSEFAIRYEASRKAELTAERSPQLVALGFDPSVYNLGEMTVAQWEMTLQGAKITKEKWDLEAQEKAQQEQAEREERNRLRKENEKLVEEQRRKDAEALRERQEIQRKADADAVAAREQQRKLSEKAEGDRKLANAKLAEERRQKEALEQKEQQRLWEEKQKADAEKKAAAKAARAPAKQKLLKRIDEIALTVQGSGPFNLGNEPQEIFAWMVVELTKILNKAREKAEAL